MLVECRQCEAVVDAIEVANYDDPDALFVPSRYTFAKCPRCRAPFLMSQDDFGKGWDEPAPLFPPKDKSVSEAVPVPIRNAFIEAVQCLRSKSFTAAAIMCRKALEGVCKDHNAPGRDLFQRLEALKQAGVIEGRLYQWADELRLVGNEAAHDVGIEVSLQDANDTIEFTRAVLEYVYTFRDQFERFRRRRTKAKKTSDAT